MNGIVSFRLCELSNQELIDAVDSKTDLMYENQEIPPRHIPARPDKDYDLLVGELLLRFKEMEEFLNQLEESADSNQKTKELISSFLHKPYKTDA